MKAHLLIVTRISILFLVLVIYPILLYAAEVPVMIRTVGSGDSSSQMWYIHPSTCDTKKAGDTGTSGLGSLAKNSSGTLYSVNYEGTLVTINPTTGRAASVAVLTGINTPSIRALTFDSNSNLLAIHKNPAVWDEENKLYKINTATGAVTLVGGMRLLGLQALTTGPDGELYAWDMGGHPFWSAGLVTVDPQTGTTTDVNPADNDDGLGGHPVKPDLQTLMFFPDGKLYGIGNGNIYTVDKNTGQATMKCVGITYGDGTGGEFVLANWVPKRCRWLPFFGGKLVCLILKPVRIAIAALILVIFGGGGAWWYWKKKN